MAAACCCFPQSLWPSSACAAVDMVAASAAPVWTADIYCRFNFFMVCPFDRGFSPLFGTAAVEAESFYQPGIFPIPTEDYWPDVTCDLLLHCTLASDKKDPTVELRAQCELHESVLASACGASMKIKYVDISSSEAGRRGGKEVGGGGVSLDSARLKANEIEMSLPQTTR